MAIYYYKAKTSTGQIETGQLDADSLQQATSKLQAKRLFPVSVKTEKEHQKSGGSAGAQPLTLKRRVKVDDIATFNRQLADLINAGIPLVKALTVLQTQTANPGLVAVVTQITQDVTGGDSLADALAKHPKIFSKLYVAMVRSGEAGGMLDRVLGRLADFAERDAETRAKLKAAAAYPAFLVIAGGGAVVMLMTYVMPKILDVFKQMEQELPLPTQILISVSNFISSFWYIIAAALIAVIAIIYRTVKTPDGKLLVDKIIYHLPMIGPVIIKQEVANFSRTLGSLLHNGVNILAALDIVHGVLDNRLVADEVKRIPESIRQGEGVSGTLGKGNIFPPVVVNMIAIGEETGRLDEILIKIAVANEIEVERRIKTLTGLMEPLILVFMGSIVGFIVISMLLPIFSIDPSGGE